VIEIAGGGQRDGEASATEFTLRGIAAAIGVGDCLLDHAHGFGNTAERLQRIGEQAATYGGAAPVPTGNISLEPSPPRFDRIVQAP
jgi:hypothetical protein